MMSMTAYSRQARQETWGQLIWEIRSVNHRYLELSFKIPEMFREFEVKWRKMATQSLSRGKVECALTFLPSEQATPKLAFNEALVDQLVSSCQRLTKYPGVNATLNAIEILRWPNVLISANWPVETIQSVLEDAFVSAINTLVTMRKQEGSAIIEILNEKLALIKNAVQMIQEKQPACLEAQKKKLMQKVSELSTQVDTTRLEQELVFYAQRVDIQEEIDRLNSHADEVSRLFKAKTSSGRRLDFLMQEMMREANTLGAKVSDNQLSQVSIDLKVTIEQMREQIQNLE